MNPDYRGVNNYENHEGQEEHEEKTGIFESLIMKTGFKQRFII